MIHPLSYLPVTFASIYTALHIFYPLHRHNVTELLKTLQ